MPEPEKLVERNALLFEAGSYPDKKITVSVDDLKRIAANPIDVPIQIGHKEAGFKLGHASKLHVKGKQLWGTLNLYPEANTLVERNGIKSLSAAIKRSLDGLKEISIVQNPRIEGAAMFTGDEDFAYFALGDTPEEGDAAAEMGKDDLSYNDQRELLAKSIPQDSYILDVFADFLIYRSYKSGKYQTCRCTYVLGDDYSVTLGKAEEVVATTVYEPVGKTADFARKDTAPVKKTWKQRLAEFAKKHLELDDTESAQFAEDFTKQPEIAEFEEVKNTLATLRTEREEAQTKAFLTEQRARLYPYETESLPALFAQLAADDADNEATITFSADGEEKTSNRVNLLKALITQRPEHGLLGEQMKSADYVALFNKTATEEKKEQKLPRPEEVYEERRNTVSGTK